MFKRFNVPIPWETCFGGVYNFLEICLLIQVVMDNKKSWKNSKSCAKQSARKLLLYATNSDVLNLRLGQHGELVPLLSFGWLPTVLLSGRF